MSDELKLRKIMPLNQTAHSELQVRGNPITTRPDATVENTFPGLEFDHRNLEKQFLDGLLIELHAGSGGWLRDYDRTRGFPFTEDDYRSGLQVWAVVGNIPALEDPGTEQLSIRWAIGTGGNGTNLGGATIWQFIREFEPGPAAVVLGPRRNMISLDQQNRIVQTLIAGQTAALPVPGDVPIVVIWGERAAYLRNGVIDPERYEPGDLTRTLCSPWQYDFTDCGCWYWASNKPDMVSVTPDGPQIYNFQRVRTGEVAPEPPTHPPVVSNDLWSDGHTPGTDVPLVERVPRQMNHAELIVGWESLAMVIGDRETDRFTATPEVPLPDSELFTDRATIVERLRYLAGIEHALMVEYLYAFYSIAAPRQRPEPAATGPLRLYEAANTILSVAIDEMRHFRWVNETLVLLGEPPVVNRAAETRDTDGNGRFLPHSFGLVPATDARLEWFITVEQSSQNVDPEVQSDTVDGMYTRLYYSLKKSGEIDQEIKDRVLHLIKLIIDEGYDHYYRFLRVRQLLPAPPDQNHLQLPENPQPLGPIDPGKGLELRVDRSYQVILNLLLILFGRSDDEHGDLLEATRIAMVDSLDVEIQNLIAAGGAPLFTPPLMTADVVLGAFSAGPSASEDGGVMVGRTAAGRASDYATVLANATAPLDALNTEALTSDDAGVRADVARSAAAMARVRAAFLSVMQSGGQ